ncbi:MAG: glycine cleavage system protein H [Anaerolineae bacterium]|nr:glycine cleavage system protein H [Anaerolineae bacterium]
MSNTPSNLKYAKSDEWFDPATGKVGISDYAQGQLSDIVFMEITVSVGDTVEAGSAIASVESVKAASDVLAPVSGKVVAVNEELPSGPEGINTDPYGAAWFIQIEGGDAAGLMDSAAYEKHCEGRAH